MEDAQIVGLYWARNERAITESSGKYGAYCNAIAHNILFNQADAEECVNDTWLRAWNAMPPHKPCILSTFLGKITRNLSFDRYKRIHREKRGGYNMDLVLDELGEVVSGYDNPEEQMQEKELKEEIDRFLFSLSEEKRHMFILRYWYADSISDIAARFGQSEGNVSVILSRVRKKLKLHLVKGGYEI